MIRTSYTFTNREYDEESGLYYYRARYYDASTGRFLQVDPDPGKLTIPSTHVNKYIYVLNNPLRYSDPKGRFVFTLTGLAVAAIVGGTISVGVNWMQTGQISWKSAGTSFASGAVAGALVYGGAWASVAILGPGALAGAIGGGIGGFMSSITSSAIGGTKWTWQNALMYTAIGALSGGTMGAMARTTITSGTSQSMSALENVDTGLRSTESSVDYSPTEAEIILDSAPNLPSLDLNLY